MKKIRLLSLFSGIGAFEKALSNIGVDYELVNYCEIDKYASKSYSLIHNESEDKNLWDITKIDIKNLPTNIDLITHGSPCQDFSIAGTNKGGDENTGTRSSLMWNSVEIIKHCKPKYVIWENVKNVLSVKHKHNFEQYLNVLSSLGYTNCYEVLNSMWFGVPQKRERLFVVSFLGNDECIFSKKDLINYIFNLENVKNINCFLEENPTGFDVTQPSMLRYIGDKVKVITNVCQTITTKQARWNNAGVIKTDNGYRYLTPKECWRLMGFDDRDVNICIENGLSNGQLYKQAGNSIVVPVLEEIFKKLFIQDNYILECNLLESIDYDYNESGIIFKDYALDLLEYEIKDLKCKKLNDHYIERHTLCEVLNRKFIVEWLDGIGEHENIYEKIYEIL